MYQVINAPAALTVVELPAWRALGDRGTPGVQVPAWPLSLSPLSLKRAPDRGLLQSLQADRPPPPLPTRGLQRASWLAWWTAALVAAAWLAWWAWRNARESASLPFAQAWRELAALPETAPASWSTLHRAFDRSAGEVLHASTLHAWLEREPRYRAAQAEIEGFFSASNARFFAGAAPVAPGLDVRALCKVLRRIEREGAS